MKFIDVIGYEDRYEISIDGKVVRNKKNKYVLSQHKGIMYYRVCLSKDGVSKCHYVHVLVWESFYKKKRKCGEVIDHKDLNPLNNNIINLKKITENKNLQRKNLYRGSKYRGVTKIKNGFTAQVSVNGRTISLGNFKDIKLAAKTYDIYVKENSLGRLLNFQ